MTEFEFPMHRLCIEPVICLHLVALGTVLGESSKQVLQPQRQLRELKLELVSG